MAVAPAPRALTAARDWLRAVSSVRQIYALYDPGHPNREDAIRELLHRTRELRLTHGGEPVLFVTRHSFYLGPTLLARESLSLYRLVEAFERAGIEALEPRANVTAEDLDALAHVLLDEAELSSTEGLAVNRVRPEATVEDEAEDTELRRSYAAGLEFLRDVARRATAGRPVDLAVTTVVVEQLVAQVQRDPTQALLLSTVRSYDEYTYYHMLNVCLLTVALGHALGLDHDQVVVLGIGALLHDIGKLNVPHDVLNHVGPLTEEQWRIVQRHPVDGAGLIFATRGGLLHPAATVVLEHHAAFDLSGYPDLSGRPWPSVPARLVAVTDCFDAVTSKRAYRRAEERRQAMNILMAEAGKGFDPRFVRAFVRLLGVYPVGSMVRLSNGETAVVVRNQPEHLARPTVRCVLDADGAPREPVEVALSENGLTVHRAVDAAELGLDVHVLLATGDVTQAQVGIVEDHGLVHEPSPGERPPAGYVDTHGGAAPAGPGGEVDPDVAPPFEE